MTNEERAIRAKTSDIDAEKLFFQLRKWFYRASYSTYNRYRELCERAGVTEEDLFQSCYFAMLEAVRGFAPESGFRFITYLNYHLKNEFNKLMGRRTERQRREPLSHSDSIDELLPGTDNLCLADQLEDEQAGDGFEEVERKADNEILHSDLERAFSCIPPQYADIIRRQYYENKHLSEIAAEDGVSPEAVRRKRNNGFQELRRGKSLSILKHYREEIINRYAYKGGLSAFRRSGASSTETAVEMLGKLEDHRGAGGL